MPVVNPFTGETYAAGTPIPMTSFARKVLNELPEANVPGASGNNYQKGVPNTTDYDKYNVRLDMKLNDRLSGFFRIGRQKIDSFEAPNIDGPSGSNQNGFINVDSQQYVFGGTYVLGAIVGARRAPRHLRHRRRQEAAGHRRTEHARAVRHHGAAGKRPVDHRRPDAAVDHRLLAARTPGDQSAVPEPVEHQPARDADQIFGRHSVKFGFEYISINTEVQDTNPLYGLDTYSSQFSRPTSAAANNQYNLADFYFGARTQYELASLIVAKMRQRGTYWYVQDDFNVNSKLTLNLGVRYEYVTPYYEGDNRMSNFDPATNTLVSASDGSMRDRALVKPDRNNFAPRFGFAYSMTDKTVLRGGYGLGYIHFNRLASAGLLATNYPIVTRATVTQALPRGADGLPTIPLCTGDNFDGLLPHDAAGLRAEPAQQRDALHPERHGSGPHPELSPLGAAQALVEHGGRPRLRRQQRDGAVDAGGHQSGAAADGR